MDDSFDSIQLFFLVSPNPETALGILSNLGGGIREAKPREEAFRKITSRTESVETSKRIELRPASGYIYTKNTSTSEQNEGT